MRKTSIYYVTLRCNDTCEFCPMWRDGDQGIRGSGSGDQEIRESGVEEIQSKLREIRIKGSKHLVVTGGEPLLRDDLADILKGAKALGFFVELYTNGILYREKGRLLNGLTDRLLFSLDYPFASEHDRSRGTECFGEVVAGIKEAKERGQKPIINYTLTRDNVRFLPEMIDLSEKLGGFLQLDPVYDFFGTQGFEAATIDYIKYYARHKTVLANLAMLEFVKAGGNRTLYPRCRAKETTVTLLPDGRRVSPCFFNPKGKQGREDVCSSCMRTPYMLPSFAQGFDKYFWLNLYSEWLNKRRISL